MNEYVKESIRNTAISILIETGMTPTIQEVRDHFWYNCDETEYLDRLIVDGKGKERYIKFFEE